MIDGEVKVRISTPTETYVRDCMPDVILLTEFVNCKSLETIDPPLDEFWEGIDLEKMNQQIEYYTGWKEKSLINSYAENSLAVDRMSNFDDSPIKKIKIVAESQDQEILDKYGDLMSLPVYSVASRIRGDSQLNDIDVENDLKNIFTRFISMVEYNAWQTDSIYEYCGVDKPEKCPDGKIDISLFENKKFRSLLISGEIQIPRAVSEFYRAYDDPLDISNADKLNKEAKKEYLRKAFLTIYQHVYYAKIIEHQMTDNDFRLTQLASENLGITLPGKTRHRTSSLEYIYRVLETISNDKKNNHIFRKPQ